MMMQLNSRVLFYIQWKCAVDLLLLCAHFREVKLSPVFTLEIKKEKKKELCFFINPVTYQRCVKCNTAGIH